MSTPLQDAVFQTLTPSQQRLINQAGRGSILIDPRLSNPVPFLPDPNAPIVLGPLVVPGLPGGAVASSDGGFPPARAADGGLIDKATDKVKSRALHEIGVALLLTSPAWITLLLLALPAHRAGAR